MKKITLTLTLLLTLTTVGFSQKNSKKTTSEIMTDSLFQSMRTFCVEVIDDFTKEPVTKKNVDKFIGYLSNHSAEEVQSMDYLSPYKTKKDTMIDYVRNDLMNLVGSEIIFQYIGWDGWDGKTPYVGFRFDLKHKNYDKQFIVIIDTKNTVHSIFSLNSR